MNPFFATCPCDKFQNLSNNFQQDWKEKSCNICKHKLIIYKDGKIVCNFNEGKFLATCCCSKIKYVEDDIMETWYLSSCDKCNTQLRVYNDKNIEIKKTGVKYVFNCVCKCGYVSYYSRLVNFKWTKETCKLCNSKLVLKTNDIHKKNICDFNFETFDPRCETLFTAICSCGSICEFSNHILKRWKNKNCFICNSNLIVYHNIRKIKVHDYNFGYLDKMQAITHAPLAEIEGYTNY